LDFSFSGSNSNSIESNVSRLYSNVNYHALAWDLLPTPFFRFACPAVASHTLRQVSSFSFPPHHSSLFSGFKFQVSAFLPITPPSFQVSSFKFQLSSPSPSPFIPLIPVSIPHLHCLRVPVPLPTVQQTNRLTVSVPPVGISVIGLSPHQDSVFCAEPNLQKYRNTVILES
jgi:hypothetical protein